MTDEASFAGVVRSIGNILQAFKTASDEHHAQVSKELAEQRAILTTLVKCVTLLKERP